MLNKVKQTAHRLLLLSASAFKPAVATNDELEYQRRIASEANVLIGTLRNERDEYRVRWEKASYELRRATSPMLLDVSPHRDTNHTTTSTRTAHKKNSPLRILCVGTGRDGTTSLSRTLQDVFDRQNSGEIAKHEWASSELNTLFCEWRETDDPCFEQQIRDIVEQCPYASGIGNGYAAVLPIFAEVLVTS